MNKKNFTIAKIIFFTIIILMFTLLVIYKSSGDNLPYSRSVQVTEVDICTISYSEQGDPISVTICGFIEFETNSVARLTISLYQMPNKNIVSRIDKSEKLFEKGYFERELNLEGTTGSYLVEIMLFRDVIGSIRFDVGR